MNMVPSSPLPAVVVVAAAVAAEEDEEEVESSNNISNSLHFSITNIHFNNSLQKTVIMGHVFLRASV